MNDDVLGFATSIHRTFSETLTQMTHKQFNLACIYLLSRLQLEPGLFRYRHHPKMHEMVSDGSSWAEDWTDVRKMSMHVFF